MSFVSVEQYNDKQMRASKRVLNMLEKTDDRMDPLYASQRKHTRKSYRQLATIVVPNSNETDPQSDAATPFNVWTRSVSQSGLSFIHPTNIDAKRIVIGLVIPNKPTIWFQGEIVRSREVPEEEFWEFGVAFHGRIKK